MFDRIPSLLELGFFALMAVTCAGIVSLFPKHDYAMMFIAMPIFLVAAIMGLRRNPQFNPAEPEVVEPDDK